MTIADDRLAATGSVRFEENKRGEAKVASVTITAADIEDGLTMNVTLRLLGELLPGVPAVSDDVLPAAPAKQRRARKDPALIKRRPRKAASTLGPAESVGPDAVQQDGPRELGGAAVTPPALPAAPPSEPTPASPPAPAAVPEQAVRRTYRTGPAPGVDDLRETFRRFRADTAAMAEHYGASRSTVVAWLSKARSNGAVIRLEGGVEPAFSS